MAIRVEQTFLSASPTTAQIAVLPPGPCQVSITALSTGASVSWGPNAATLTATTGAILSAGQGVTIDVPAGSISQTLFGTGIGGTAIVGVSISSPN